MSYRVIVKGTACARLVDVECHKCGLLLEDVWRDEIEPSCPECHASEMVEVFRSAPMIDFRNTKPITLPGYQNKKFTSHRSMEAWAKRHNKVVMTENQFEQLPHDTPEERIEKANAPKRTEAIKKATYKIRHGLT